MVMDKKCYCVSLAHVINLKNGLGRHDCEKTLLILSTSKRIWLSKATTPKTNVMIQG